MVMNVSILAVGRKGLDCMWVECRFMGAMTVGKTKKDFETKDNFSLPIITICDTTTK